MLLRAFDPSETDEVVKLWELCGLTQPWNDPIRDIHRKLDVQPELFLVGIAPDDGAEAHQVIATVMAGYDGHRG